MSRREFSGIIVLRENQILLVKRSANDKDMASLWSLPAGSVDKGETSKQAAIRELREETNLSCNTAEFLFSIERYSWKVDVFKGSCFEYNYKTDNDEIEKIDFFDLKDLPQKIVIDSYLIIQRFIQINSISNVSYSKMVDHTFTSIYYSYLHKELMNLEGLDEIFKYIIERTPHRKFKSIVPFLFSRPSKIKFPVLILPEVTFAIWTLLDDCVDGKTTRYGEKTAPSYFGSSRSIISLFNYQNNLLNTFLPFIRKESLYRVINALNKSGLILKTRLGNRIELDFDSYLSESKERTRFLRESWKTVLIELEASDTETEIIYNVQEQSAELGQLINDYFDIYKNEFEDFRNRVVTAPTILLRDGLNGKDLSRLETIWKDGCVTDSLATYSDLIKEYNIENQLRTLISNKIKRVIEYINNSELSMTQKDILVNWHELSLEHFPIHNPTQLTAKSFVSHIENLINDY